MRFVRRVLFVPGVPRAIAWCAKWLPKRPVRGRTGDMICDWEDCDTDYVSNAARYYGKPKDSVDVQRSVQEALGREPAEVARAARPLNRALRSAVRAAERNRNVNRENR